MPREIAVSVIVMRCGVRPGCGSPQQIWS